MDDKQFYEYVSLILRGAGHMITSDPVYFNHSASETLYIDSNMDVAVSRFDRTLLMQIRNVSRLIEIKWPGVVDDLTESVQIYSITVDAPERNRSQIVADTHRLLHQYWDCLHSIIFFKNRDQYIISFANKEKSHILSDWFDINVDYDEIVEKLDIGNFSLDSSNDYFCDFIYAVARDYYIHPISVEEATYGMMPLTFVASAFGVTTEVSKDDIKALARANMATFESQYGDDYVAPVYIGVDEQAQFRRMATELDRISFELELAAEMEDEEGVDAFDDSSDDDFDELDDDFADDWADNIDAEIFDDPILMVKWLEQRQKQLDEEGAGMECSPPEQNQKDPSLGGQVHREIEYSERERIEAERREQERIAALRIRLAELDEEHEKAIDRINNNYSREQLQISSNLAAIANRLREIESRVSSLNFLQFMERKKLEAERAELLDKRDRMNRHRKELEVRFRKQIAEERQHYETGKSALGL